MADDWPTLGEELSRKAITALENIVEKYKNDEASRDQVLAVVDALYTTISGLAPWDATNIIIDIGKRVAAGER